MISSLILLNGPSPGAGVAVDPKSDGVTIGRDAGCGLPIDDHLCSRLHARVWFDGQQWQIEDCGSSNGTCLNSREIQRETLKSGDLIRVGDRLIAFVLDAANKSPRKWMPDQIASTTFVVRVREPEKQQPFTDRIREGDDSTDVRELSHLCRLFGTLQNQISLSEMVDAVVASLKEGTGSDSTSVWLTGTDGRLHRADRSGGDDNEPEEPHFLAGLAVENNEAILVAHETGETSSGSEGDVGTTICVPIPGRSGRRGSIHCYRKDEAHPLAQSDLDYVMAVAHQFGLALQNLEYREQLERGNQQLRESILKNSTIVGNSPSIGELMETVARVAATNATVLIEGESGTGKELIARILHDSSQRRTGPYITVNCAAFNESLLESELFGHEKGAFTGADRRRVGQFERAHFGTIFLDEIGEMSRGCQAKLLRLMEGHPFERLGGSEQIQVDVRIIAATHRNLEEMVRRNEFREDLYYRLRVVELSIPPLRDRDDDVLVLAAHFIEHFRREIGYGPTRLSEEAAQELLVHDWPGNVRELKNAIERAMVLGRNDEISVNDLALSKRSLYPADEAAPPSLAEIERQHINFVLNSVNGNKTQACRILGIGRGTLYKKLQENE